MLNGKRNCLMTLIHRPFILEGLYKGFGIIDRDANPIPARCDNHPSARPGSPLYERTSEQVLNEIHMGHYEVVQKPPDIISPIGVIPKPDGR